MTQMQPIIQELPETKLIGKHLSMSLAFNKTGELWGSFMPLRHTIQNRKGHHFISMQVYNAGADFTTFNPHQVFEKWAAVEVTDFSYVPDGLETYTIRGGLYAIFLHKGPASEGRRTFEYIFDTWLRHSEYTLDQREHFEWLDERYKNNEPDSEEEIWIPVKLR